MYVEPGGHRLVIMAVEKDEEYSKTSSQKEKNKVGVKEECYCSSFFYDRFGGDGANFLLSHLHGHERTYLCAYFRSFSHIFLYLSLEKSD